VCDFRERDGIGQLVQVLDPAAMIEGQKVGIEGKLVDVVLQHAPEKFVIELAGVVQLPPVDRIQAPQEVAGSLPTPFERLDAVIAPAVVVSRVAELRGQQREFGEPPFPVLVE
jgi:hypothetical protein